MAKELTSYQKRTDRQTKRGTTYANYKGFGGGFENLGTAVLGPIGTGLIGAGLGQSYQPTVEINSGNGDQNLKLLGHDMVSLTDKDITSVLNWIKANPDKVGTTEYENKISAVCGKTNLENKIAYFDATIDENADLLGFDSRGSSSKSSYIQNEDGTYREKTQDEIDQESATSKEDASGIDYYRQLVDENLMTDPYGTRANQYRQDMYSSINSYEQASQNSLASAELDAYRMLGQQQLQLESEIANQRMTALKSGTTSAQLASQQLANMFAAQSAAQQTAAGVLQQRATMADTYNQQRAAVTSDLYNMTNNNALTAANAYAQLGAAQASYNSYINQPYAQYMAAMQAYNRDPAAYRAINTAYTDDKK